MPLASLGRPGRSRSSFKIKFDAKIQEEADHRHRHKSRPQTGTKQSVESDSLKLSRSFSVDTYFPSFGTKNGGDPNKMNRKPRSLEGRITSSNDFKAGRRRPLQPSARQSDVYRLRLEREEMLEHHSQMELQTADGQTYRHPPTDPFYTRQTMNKKIDKTIDEITVEPAVIQNNMNSLRLDNWLNNTMEASKNTASIDENNKMENILLEDVEISETSSYVPTTNNPRRKLNKGKRLEDGEAKKLKLLMFGATNRSFSDGWLHQAFCFENNSSLRFGLVQNKGGPCGVLAAVQTQIIKVLRNGSSDFNVMKAKNVLDPTDTERKTALAAALSEIILKSSKNKNGPFVMCSIDGRVSGSANVLQRDGITENIVQYTHSDPVQMYNFVHDNLSFYCSRGTHALVAFVYSCILTRGIEEVKTDFDNPETTLLAAHNYSTQELVNLLITGCAVSNVFDNNVDLDNGKIILKGIKEESEVGFLSLFEHYKSCEVGRNLKNPSNPIWVVCSESHFSVLFSVADINFQDKFDLYYYDELARQEDLIRLTLRQPRRGVLPSGSSFTGVQPQAAASPSPLENCIRTKWRDVDIDWNGSEKLL